MYVLKRYRITLKKNSKWRPLFTATFPQISNVTSRRGAQKSFRGIQDYLQSVIPLWTMISSSSCAVSYVSIEDAIQLVKTLGVCSSKTYTAKTDIKKYLGLSPFAQSTTASSVSNGIVSSISRPPWECWEAPMECSSLCKIFKTVSIAF